MIKYAILAVTFFCLSSCSNNKEDACKNFYSKYQKELEKDSRDTIALLNKLSSFLDKNSCLEISLLRGDLYFALDSLKAAKKDFLECLKFDSGNIYSLNKLGLILQLEENDDSAIIFFQKGLKLKARSGVLINYYKSADPELNSFKSKYDVDFNLLRYNIAISLYYKDQYKAALEYLNLCINDSFKLEETYYFAGSIYLSFNQNTKACEYLNKSYNLGNEEAAIFIKKYCK